VWRNPPGRRRVTARRSRLRRRGTLLQSAGRQLRGLWGGVGWVVWSPRRLAGVSKFRSSGGRGRRSGQGVEMEGLYYFPPSLLSHFLFSLFGFIFYEIANTLIYKIK
jgi:hypothetical protein